MNKVFALENEKSWQSVYVTSDKLFLINKSYDTPEEFLQGYNAEGLSRFLKSKMEIEFSSISSIHHDEHEPDDLDLVVNGHKVNLHFKNKEDLKEVTDFVAGAKKLTATTEQVGKFKAIQSPLIGLGFTIGMGWLLYTDAATLEAGGEVNVSGRRAGFKRLLAWVSEQLGTKGVLICAAIAAVICLYFIYKNLKTPPNQVTYA
jgi:hypothetical protein